MDTGGQDQKPKTSNSPEKPKRFSKFCTRKCDRLMIETMDVHGEKSPSQGKIDRQLGTYVSRLTSVFQNETVQDNIIDFVENNTGGNAQYDPKDKRSVAETLLRKIRPERWSDMLSKRAIRSISFETDAADKSTMFKVELEMSHINQTLKKEKETGNKKRKTLASPWLTQKKSLTEYQYQKEENDQRMDDENPVFYFSRQQAMKQEEELSVFNEDQYSGAKTNKNFGFNQSTFSDPHNIIYFKEGGDIFDIEFPTSPQRTAEIDPSQKFEEMKFLDGDEVSSISTFSEEGEDLLDLTFPTSRPRAPEMSSQTFDYNFSRNGGDTRDFDFFSFQPRTPKVGSSCDVENGEKMPLQTPEDVLDLDFSSFLPRTPEIESSHKIENENEVISREYIFGENFDFENFEFPNSYEPANSTEHSQNLNIDGEDFAERNYEQQALWNSPQHSQEHTDLVTFQGEQHDRDQTRGESLKDTDNVVKWAPKPTFSIRTVETGTQGFKR